MKLKVYTVNSFAKTIEGGNPAGVVLDADSLSDESMKKIAGAIGFSETAFVMKSESAHFKVRFFTPEEEVELCGHATIATFYVLLSKGLIKPGVFLQETKAGILSVEVREDSSIMMEQNAPSFYEIVNRKEIADSLNINENEMIDILPVQVVSTGLRDILIPVKSIDILNSIKPNFEEVSQISSKYNTIGYHVFTFESLFGSNAHCRNFAPLYGIREEAATGTSNGALACYLYKYGNTKTKCDHQFVMEQGYSMKKPSEIIVELIVEGLEVIEVKVGGKVLNLSEIEVEI
ncbi:PhzF family phenazine biosynthesis protein [Ornithinibacillus sp. BX22]|uniref:PhzF family phenazine biosynthesis protein n=1 Tax=Ornithinibacillus hominis TaxID=2763055 RepID=A0A923L4D6_9BACI|nr:PhzF family phenazine biosynthesis protein [Ornithinibacillus hominis]MBC5636279.1 PhzF family phenazine biosynthesis protein [Ornithinibacillus hominis]